MSAQIISSQTYQLCVQSHLFCDNMKHNYLDHDNIICDNINRDNINRDNINRNHPLRPTTTFILLLIKAILQ
jgi:hypothetical protein